jgi:NHLM bacteriocin system ABC transporter ATP-binding protein
MYDSQIRERIAFDDKVMSEAFIDMSSIVMGERLTQALNDSRILTRNAIEEVLKYYHVLPPELPENVVNVHDQLDYILRPSGIMRRKVILEGAWYRDAIGPMLGMKKDDRTPVALLPHGSGYVFRDPATGKNVKLNRKTAGQIDREAVCFYKPLPPHSIGIHELLRYILKCLQPSDYVLIAAATIAATVIGMLLPLLNNVIFGYVVSGTDMQLFFSVFSFLLTVYITRELINVTKSLLLERIRAKGNVSVEAAGMMRILSLPAGFFKDFSSGELANRISYLNSLCDLLAESVLSLGLTSVFSLVYIGQMFRYGPGLVLPAMLVIILTVAVSAITMLVQISISQKKMEAMSKENGITYAMFSGIQKIRLAGAEKRAFAKWAKTYTPAARLEYDPPAILRLNTVFQTSLMLIGTVVIYYFTITTKVAFADYFSFNSAYAMVVGAFTALAGVVGNIAQIRPIMKLLEPILKEEPEVSGNKTIVTRLSGGIDIDNVSFRYEEKLPLILNNLSLKIRPGQYIAVVGRTGCGKSTLMRLLLGFEKPQKGAIYFDGKDATTLDQKSLRQHIGSVLQEGKLFQGDIYSNITLSMPWLTMDDAWEAAEMAGVADDIRAMPMGMHTLISEGSGGISGGQKQRLMIARAIAPKPKILIFDEATSALDNMTQQIVTNSLDSLKCTRIVIAHRLSTIRLCDRIIVLDGGNIVEDGTYDQLIEKKGVFAELVERQRLEN